MTIEPGAAETNDEFLRVVVVGGGFTGAVLIIHLVRAADRPLRIIVVEPSADLGRGIAYGTHDPAHRINVPSGRMGLFEADPSEATRWFFDEGVLPDDRSTDDQGHFYVPRRAYGTFVGAMIGRTLDAAKHKVDFQHRRRSARGVTRFGSCWRVLLDDGASLEADRVALCFGHAVPHLPCAVDEDVRLHRKFNSDPWAGNALAAIEPDDRVLVVGTGLTMADVAVGLRDKGHRGAITAVSRRGLLSLPHGRFVSDIDILDGEPPPATAVGLLRLLRRRLRAWEPALGWQPVVDALRFKLPVLWGALPPGEQARVLRRLLPFWEVHRFRIAPQLHTALQRDIASGGLRVERGGLIGLALDKRRFIATLRRPQGRTDRVEADAVVLCTGPDKDLRNNPLIASLLKGGLAKLDRSRFGLAVDLKSHVLRLDDTSWPTLFAFGPMTRGTFGEMTGAPDITRHLERTASEVLKGRQAAENRLART